MKAVPLYVHPDTIIGPNRSYVWFCIPKNASRSVRAFLRASGGSSLTEHTKKGQERTFLAELPEEPLTFAFLRDPFARLLSAWRNKVNDPPDTEGQRALMSSSVGLRKGMSLGEFVDWIKHQYSASSYVDSHWRRQVDYVCDDRGRTVVIQLGAVDTIDKEFETIAARLGVKGPFLKLNTSATPYEPAIESFDATARATVREVYAADFELWEKIGTTP